MRWHVTYTISMGKHGNQRIPTFFEGDLYALDEFFEALSRKAPETLIIAGEHRKAFLKSSVLLIEWSESK